MIADDFAAIRAALGRGPLPMDVTPAPAAAPPAPATPGLPRQLSGDPNHPAYDPYWAGRVQVLLDGVPVSAAQTYDADAGWVDVARTQGPSGQWQVIRLRGVVTLVDLDAKGPPP